MRAASWMLLSWYHEYLPTWVSFPQRLALNGMGFPFPSLPYLASQPSGEKGRKKGLHTLTSQMKTSHACVRVRVGSCPPA